jgi:hypothetical protein
LILKTQFGLPLVFLICVLAAGCSTSERKQQDTGSEKKGGLVQPDHVHLAGLVIFRETQPNISKHLGRDVEPLWTPPTNVVREALNQLPSYLLSTNKGPLAHPLYAEKCLPAKENLPESTCQAAGVTFEGQKGVLLNFLPTGRPFTSDWRKHFIKVYDRGPRYWSVIYLNEEKKFTALYFDLGY